MNVVLVWPKGFDTSYTVPLSLAYLKSNVDPKKHTVTILDNSLDSVSADSQEFSVRLNEIQPDVVGVSCWSPTYHEAIRVLEIAKKTNPKIVTVLGGAHATSYAERILNTHHAVDFIFRGEADLSFSMFLEQAEKPHPDWSQVKGLMYRKKEDVLETNDMEREKDLDRIKLPDYEAIRFGEYLKRGYRFNTSHKQNAPVWVTRGCPYRCAFCSASLQNGKLVRKHSIEYMVEWVKYLYHEKNIRQINIIDDNFTFDIDYAKAFCKAMIDLDLHDLYFGTPNGIRMQRTDEELIHLMKKAGWENLVIAPESGSERTLKRMRKDLNLDLIPKKVEQIKKAGLKVHGFFIIGYPGETVEDVMKTRELIRKCKFNFFFLNNFQPLPGTPVYEELLTAKEIEDGLLPKNYSDGERVYVPEALKNFNFSRFVLQEYMHLALTYPTNIPYMFKTVSPDMAVRKVLSNIKNMITKGNSEEKSH